MLNFLDKASGGRAKYQDMLVSAIGARPAAGRGASGRGRGASWPRPFLRGPRPAHEPLRRPPGRVQQEIKNRQRDALDISIDDVELVRSSSQVA
jgi:hypothetical protein